MENEVLARFVDPARMRVEIATGSGHSIEMDGGAPDGDDSGARPMETLLAALAGCTSMDVASILRKKRQVPTDYAIAVRGEHGEAHPRVFTRIVVEHRVSGAVDPEAIRRSVELSAARYCPVSAMLSSAATIEHWYRLGDQAAVLVVTTGPSPAAG